MLKRYFFPVLCLSLVVVACGKKDAPAENIQTVQVPYVAPIGTITPPPWTGDIQSFCNQFIPYGLSATVTNGVCKVSGQKSYTIYLQFGTSYLPLTVNTSDRITISGIGSNVQVFVGWALQATGASTFFSNNTGQLGFKSSNFNWSTTVNVQQDRCYNSSGQVIQCP